MRVTIFDYGAGNLHSLSKAISASGAQVVVETDPRRCVNAELLVLPGVGGFGQAAMRLAPGLHELQQAIRGGLPTLGICLGLQLLFEHSEEGDGAGLGVIEGRVTRLRATRVPQIGWNGVEHAGNSLLCASELTTAYYANSFACRPVDASSVIAWSTHETDRFPAMIRAGSAMGVQFHPEKSSAAGIRFLAAALEELRP